jgi:16S rRNA G1207 methylase RsmC
VILEKYPARLFTLYANEIHRERYLELLSILDKVSQDDFLNFKEMKFDKFIMNPPFSKSQDVKHILKAYELLNE